MPTVVGLPFLNIPKKYTDSIRNGPHTSTMYPCLLQAIEMQTKQGVCHKKIRPKISFSSLLDITTTTTYISTTFW